MIKEMLNSMEQLVELKVENQSKSLLIGAEKKTYTPLLKRPKCGKNICVEIICFKKSITKYTNLHFLN